jgi:cytochrome c oxidase cbb3-type subunit 3
VIEKNKSSQGKALATTAVLLLVLVSQSSNAQTAEAPIRVLPNYGGLSSTTFYLLTSVICIEVIIILFLAASVKNMYAALMPQKEAVAVKQKVLFWKKWWLNLDKKIFTKAIPVEKEAGIMLDHDYDGIRELDNALPPWWKYGFYFTIIAAVIYMLNFHVFGTGKILHRNMRLKCKMHKLRKSFMKRTIKIK